MVWSSNFLKRHPTNRRFCIEFLNGYTFHDSIKDVKHASIQQRFSSTVDLKPRCFMLHAVYFIHCIKFNHGLLVTTCPRILGRFYMVSSYIKTDDTSLTHSTVCPRSRDLLYIVSNYIKLGHYFFDTQYLEKRAVWLPTL